MRDPYGMRTRCDNEVVFEELAVLRNRRGDVPPTTMYIEPAKTLDDDQAGT